jgi:hypothetical protein
MVTITHKSNNGGAKAMIQRLEMLSSQKVCVGIPASTSSRGDNNKIGNADLAYIHTHGVRLKNVRVEMQKEINKGTKYSVALQMYIHEHGSFIYQVPPRPIIQPAIEDAKGQIGERLGEAAKVALQGGDTNAALTDVGTYAQSKVKKWFKNPKNGWAPNAESTIEKKKSSNPLIDTGALHNAITFVIQEG